MLLMHRFHKEGYVVPDKFVKGFEEREVLKNDLDDDDDK